MQTASESLWPSIIAILPSILWFLLIVGVFVLFYRQIRDELIPNLSGFKAVGMEVSFVRDQVATLITLAEKSPKWPVHITAVQRKTIIDRALKNTELFRDASILWVDDSPENNVNEVKMLQDLKSEVVQVATNQAALGLFAMRGFDVVVSDVSRPDDATAGLKLAPLLREKGHSFTPVILYIGAYDPERGVPAHVFGVANRPDQLLHLIIDALERRGC